MRRIATRGIVSRGIAILGLVVAACGIPPAPTPVPNATPVGTTGPNASFASTIEMLAAVRAASVRLVVTAKEQAPGATEVSTSSASGSGFVISPEGLVVTNDHVAGTATKIQAFVGESGTPVEGFLVGSSECTDIAVVRLEGGPYPSLSWFDGSVAVGLEVFSAGYPLGETQFTASRGIISKLQADKDNRWSSPRHVIEHDADAAPGSSGSPLVTTDGSVVGVEYAGTRETGRNFAIDRDVAKPIIDELLARQPAESIGIHGESFEQGALAGVWVMGVTPGSAAAKVGIEPGDVITHLGGLSTASGGSLHDFCSVVRRKAGDDRVDIRVVRLGSGVTELKGQLNGAHLASTGRTPDYGLNGVYTAFETISDDDRVISVEVPAAWADHDGRHWEDANGTDFGPSLTAAVDIDSFWDSYDSSGLFISASALNADEYDEDDYVENLSYARACSLMGPRALKITGAGSGWLYRYHECDDDQRGEAVVWVHERAGRTLISVEAQLSTDADRKAFDRALATLTVDE